MRIPAILAALALTATACGSSGDGSDGADTLPPPATEGPTEVTATSRPTAATTTSTEPGTPPRDDEAIAPPEDGQNADPRPSSRRLSIEDALLPDDAFPPPWEPQWRQLDRVGYPAGPNQTDCDEYWRYESLLGRAGAEALWWIDGGNANHFVIRMADASEILPTLIAAGTVADACPTVTWNEGGSFTTELIELDDAIGLRFDDAAGGEVTWALLTTFGDLVSVLHIPLWTRTDGTMIEVERGELERLAALMLRQLENAGPAEEAVVVTTTEPVPIIEPPATEPPVAVTAIGELLLGRDDLPDGWEYDGVSAYTSSPTDAALIDVCPAAGSIDRVDVALEWEADYESALGSSAYEIIGEMDTAAEAVAAVEEFATVWECDLGVLIEGATATGGPVELSGADAAGRLVIEAPELGGARAELVLVAIGPVVAVVSEEVPPQAASSVIELARLAVDKIVAAADRP